MPAFTDTPWGVRGAACSRVFGVFGVLSAPDARNTWALKLPFAQNFENSSIFVVFKDNYFFTDFFYKNTNFIPTLKMFCPDYGNLAPLLFLHVVGHAVTDVAVVHRSV